MVFSKLIDDLNDNKENECNDKEIDNCVYECAPVDVDRLSEVGNDSWNSFSCFVYYFLGLVYSDKEGVELAEGILADEKREDPVDYRLEDIESGLVT